MMLLTSCKYDFVFTRRNNDYCDRRPRLHYYRRPYYRRWHRLHQNALEVYYAIFRIRNRVLTKNDGDYDALQLEAANRSPI